MPTDRPLPAAHNPHSVFSLALGLIGLVGVAALFLPFAGDTPFLAYLESRRWYLVSGHSRTHRHTPSSDRPQGSVDSTRSCESQNESPRDDLIERASNPARKM